MNSIDENTLREEIVSIGRRAYQKGYIVAGEGNFSVRLDENRILTTPSGLGKGFLNPEDLVVVDPRGNHLAGARKASSELPMHLEIYRSRPDARAVCHTHAPYALSFAVNRRPLDTALMPEAVVMLGAVLVVPYATPSTQEVPDNLSGALKNANAFLLANHGVVTVGETLAEAFDRMEAVEHLAKVTFMSHLLGSPCPLSRAQLAALEPVRDRFGRHACYTPLKSAEDLDPSKERGGE